MAPSIPRTVQPSVYPSATTFPSLPVITVLPDPQIAPRAVVTSSPSTSTPNAVLIDLHTTVLIPDYSSYYDGQIETFRPSYHALADGSLVASPLIADIQSANFHLAVTSALAMFFLVETITSVQYLRRAKVKKKGLFYVLFISQLFGFISFLATLIPFFNERASCMGSSIVARITTGVSYSLLLTGILGVKAYRCLNNSRVVLFILTILRSAMIFLLGFDMISSPQSTRRLSGSCTTDVDSTPMLVVIILQTLESAFICGCFMFAVWQASRTRGRMSIRLSTDGDEKFSPFGGTDPSSDAGHSKRGWWDYVPPEAPQPPLPPLSQPRSPTDPNEPKHLFGGKLWGPGNDDDVPPLRKSSIPGDYPILHAPRASSVAFSNYGYSPRESSRMPDVTRPRVRAISPKPPSVMSRLSKYIPRMQLFKEVLKNELYYTAFITVLLLVTAIMMLLGITREFLLNIAGWIGLNWTIVSFFVIHSFSRVIRRHEREAILQHPSAWDPMYRAELEAARAFNRGGRRAFSPVSLASRRVPRTVLMDPFGDPRSRTNSIVPSEFSRSTHRGRTESRSEVGSATALGPRPWMASRSNSISSSLTSSQSSAALSLREPPHLFIRTQWDNTAIPPSPISTDVDDCPCMDTTSSDSIATPIYDNDKRTVRAARAQSGPSITGEKQPSSVTEWDNCQQNLSS